MHPTHREGGTIDLVFFLSSNPDIVCKVIQQSQFYTDHDLIEVVRGTYGFFEITKYNSNLSGDAH